MKLIPLLKCIGYALGIVYLLLYLKYGFLKETPLVYIAALILLLSMSFDILRFVVYGDWKKNVIE